MNRADLQKLARLRLREAKLLLDNEFYDGSYYLCGYTVECALKACIAKNTKQFDFPDKSLINQIYTHKLADLVKAAGLGVAHQQEIQGSPQFQINWNIV